jgi:ferric-dicitrate binding protein FerR (iron transport regulator)
VTYEKLVSAEIRENDLEEAVNTAEKPLLVNLPDGSSVLLLKGSRLSFNKESFNQSKREVYLSGEAFFEVAKNQEKPFFVYANELVTKVLGTSFTIRAFENSQNVEVVVKTGKVSVFTQQDPQKENKLKDDKLEGLVLLPNEQIVLKRTELKLSRSKIEKPELLTLPAQKLSFEFDDVPFGEVVETIERAYGVEIVFDSELLSKCRLTAYLSDEPLKDKIRMICDALSARSEVIDGKIHIKASPFQTKNRYSHCTI